MLVQSERDINISKLLDELKFRIDQYNKTDTKGYTTSVNIQTLIDSYDVIKILANEGDDRK